MTSKTPAKGTPSSNKQRSITSFFSKTPSRPTAATGAAASSPIPLKVSTNAANAPLPQQGIAKSSRAHIMATTTPAQSSDPVVPSSPTFSHAVPSSAVKPRTIRSRMPSNNTFSRARKVNYAESDDEDGDPFEFLEKQSRRRNRGRAVVADDDEDGDFDTAEVPQDDDEEMEDFVVSDEDEPHSKKRKRSSKPAPPRKRAAPSPKDEQVEDVVMDEAANSDLEFDLAMGLTTAEKWGFDEDTQQAVRTPPPVAAAEKTKAYQTEPSERYSWLADIRDMDGNRPGHPDYNPATIHVPPSMFGNGKKCFSPFEKQYWEIKQRLWDTVMFFKKGKFYELYENDATIGHREFDLKMTDRVNMRMVGVPESSYDMWANQFVAKGYKVARVDQMESALGKEIRERGESAGKAVAKSEDKIIRRELACILTAGTLVEASMLQDDLATYCASIKMCNYTELPVFGIAFVDTATGRFFVSQFEDDEDLTKFETFVAQTSPRELVVEKNQLSSKAMRILKNNTGPLTIWNHRKPESEFWDADVTRRDLQHEKWFTSEADPQGTWPDVLREAHDKDELMSALGGLVQYLRSLKVERSLLSQRNFEWYSPIQKNNGSLILDGKTLINLEIFANSLDGGTSGTLFSLLNRCVTPFGKRLLRLWVCHPLSEAKRIGERLDAIDLFNADPSMREQFVGQLTRMPDLERLLSRIHARSCRGDDFLRVVEGFEQFSQAASLLSAYAGGSKLVDELVASMPDLSEPLSYWNSAFDRRKARDDKVLMPLPGVLEEYDESMEKIAGIKGRLHGLLMAKQKELNCKTLKFTDIGKEIYQIEAPKKVNVPTAWRMMSSTSSVKRWYFPELTTLIRELQEAEEMHSQVMRFVSGHFLGRFDEDYETWSKAIRIVAQLDCLVSLARVSSSLSEPCCRPEFVEEGRTVVEFSELRHPCMLGSVDEFIPNDILLGGKAAKINLLTGANAAGKSTVLRMTCTAVIMAQIGCHVPAMAARLTPVDRIMSRLGANDNIFAAQSTFFVELAETKKILCEATPRSLVILDELGRGTSSYDGLAVAQAVLHHVATHIGCVGFFATHYHSLAAEFASHPEIRARRMRIHVDEAARRINFLYRLEDGIAEGSFGMHCASMCGIMDRIVDRAEEAAREFEHTSKLKASIDRARTGCYIPAGMMSDVEGILRGEVDEAGMRVLLKMIGSL